MHQPSSASPSVAASDISLLWRAKVPILGATVLAGVLGWSAGWLIPATYRSEIDLRIGHVMGTPVENPYAVAKRINAYGFRASLFPEELKRLGHRMVTAEVAEGSPTAEDRTPVYVYITTLGSTSAAAADHARRVVERIGAEHRPLYDAALKQHVEYEGMLAEQLERARTEASRLATQLTGFGNERGAGASAVLLLQTQLESRQSHVVELGEKLRDARIKRQNETFATEPLAPPSNTGETIWPRKLLIAAVSASAAFLVALLIVLLRPALRTDA